MSYDSDKASDRNTALRQYDRSLEPHDEKEKSWTVSVTIMREYEGNFYGTKESAEEQAKNYFKRKSHEFIEENMIAESWDAGENE